MTSLPVVSASTAGRVVGERRLDADPPIYNLQLSPGDLDEAFRVFLFESTNGDGIVSVTSMRRGILEGLDAARTSPPAADAAWRRCMAPALVRRLCAGLLRYAIGVLTIGGSIMARMRLEGLAVVGVVVAMVTVLGAAPARAASFTVTNTSDTGAGSLDQAITDANTNAGPDTITFSAATNGFNIVDNDLPGITSDITITGNGVGVTIIQTTDSLTIDAQGGATVVASVSGVTVTGTGQIGVNSGIVGSTATGTFTNVALLGGRDVNVNAGDGTTTAAFTNLTMGAGSDININAGNGTTNATMSNVTMVDGDVNINSGSGTTTATITDITVPDGVNVNTGSGITTATFTNATVSRSTSTAFNANSGNGTTTATLTNSTVTANQGTAINANAGQGTTNLNLTEVQATSPNGTVMSLNAGRANGTTATVVRSSFINSGNGINVNLSVLNMTNSTVSNLADEADMIDARGSTVNLTNVTMMNSDNNGMSIFDGATATLKNTIIAGVDNDNCSGGGTIVSTGGNISDDATCTTFTATGDDQNVNPLLGPLANNSGSTLTHLPQALSPAIDGGVEAGCPANDQRLVLRPQDGNGDTVVVCDSGSVEIESLVLPPVGADTDPLLTFGLGLLAAGVLVALLSRRRKAIS